MTCNDLQAKKKTELKPNRFKLKTEPPRGKKRNKPEHKKTQEWNAGSSVLFSFSCLFTGAPVEEC